MSIDAAERYDSERAPEALERPTVTIVFLVFNRRDELRESLLRMLDDSDYPRDRVDVIVVDNASTDGSADMVREEFPDVRLIVREENIGVSGWNEGLAAAEGDWLLVLDDDCYLPPDGLRRSIEAARDREADLVSFKVVSTQAPDHVFTEGYRTGLFSFWGCAVLMKREVARALGGYDPEIFVWANELEFMIRFFDRGFRHLHFPEVVAQHMKAPPETDIPYTEVNWKPYLYNCRHFAYIAGKLFKPRDSIEAFFALLVRAIRDWMRGWTGAIGGVTETVAGYLHGVRHRDPVQNAEVSRFYRHNFETFASPWWLSRPIGDMLLALPREALRGQLIGESRPTGLGRREQYFEDRAHLYPSEPAVLEFTGRR